MSWAGGGIDIRAECFASGDQVGGRTCGSKWHVDARSAGECIPSYGSEGVIVIVTKEYIIGPEDLLEITVWRNQDLSKTVAVRPDGRISMPLIGDVAAVGKTPSQLTEEIASKSEGVQGKSLSRHSGQGSQQLRRVCAG